MTPMIDVVFLLLVFFVCAAASQIHEQLLPAEMAAGSIDSAQAQSEPRPFGEIWLFLKMRQGRISVQLNQGGTQFRDLDQLSRQLQLLAAATTDVPIILDIEADVPLGDMITVYDACYAQEFRSIHFATRASAVRGKGAAESAPAGNSNG
jgi:biopolymer transport protein ExbD